MINSILGIVERELLTPKGLRTLSPNDPAYIGIYEGDQASRDAAYHQGTVWPWLLQPYAMAYLKLHKTSGIGYLRKIVEGFESDMSEYGVGTVGEIFDGDPPHLPRGSISQAWSVAALLWIDFTLNKLEKNLKQGNSNKL